MDRGYLVLLGIIGVGVAYGLLRPRRATAKGRGGWAGLAVLAFLFAGLLLSSLANSETLTWFFGLSLMAALPIMLFLAVGSSIGSFLRRRSRDPTQDQ